MKLSRREFIKVQLISGIGFCLGIDTSTASTISEQSRFAPNIWLRVYSDNQIEILLVEAEMGQGVRTSLPMLIAEEMNANIDNVFVSQAPLDKAYGWQGTGGSSSLRGAWQKLREAGAVAREMFITAASQHWKTRTDDCETANGYVIHKKSDKKLSFGSLIESASRQPVPKNVKLKNKSEYNLIGRSIPLYQVDDILHGKAIYGIDVDVPDMFIATVIHGPVFGSKLKTWAAKGADKLEGIKLITPISSGLAIIAKSFWQTQLAARKIEIDWQEPAHKPDDKSITHLLDEALEHDGEIKYETGEVSFGQDTISRNYYSAYQAHATMEPMCCTANVNKSKCEIWVPTQQITAAQQAAARASGIKQKNITVNTTLLGGGFGRRNIQDFVIEAVEISKTLKAPIKLIWSREEDIQHDYYHPRVHHNIKAKLNKKGYPVSWHHKYSGPAYSSGADSIPYTIPNIKVEAIETDTGIPIGPWRSVAHHYHAFAIESFINELADKSSIDPFKYRKNLLANDSPLLSVLTELKKRARWQEQLYHNESMGMSIHSSFGSHVGQVARVKSDREGNISVKQIDCVIDCGIAVHPSIIKAQIEGSIVFALSAIFDSQVNIKDGRVAQSNFHNYPLLRISNMPKINVYILENSNKPGGVGEPGVPPCAPAVASAIHAATGIRNSSIPFQN